MSEMETWKKVLLSVALVFVFAMWLGFRSQLGMNGILWWVLMGAICLAPLNMMWGAGEKSWSKEVSKDAPSVGRTTNQSGGATVRKNIELPQEFSAYSALVEKEPAMPAVDVTPSIQKQEPLPVSEPVDEEAIYAIALKELETNSMRPGIWAKAFSETEGDERKTRALYIKFRVSKELEEIRKASKL